MGIQIRRSALGMCRSLLMRLPTLLDLTGVAGGGSEPFEKGGQTGVLYTLLTY